jgi:hypothetical protein
METSVQAARQSLAEIIQQLEDVVPTVNFDEEISLQAITPYMHTFKSTFGREVRECVKLVDSSPDSYV